jgi:endoglucanase
MKKNVQLLCGCKLLIRLNKLPYMVFILLIMGLSGCDRQPKTDSLSFLKVKGHDMVDEAGNKVVLHSVGLGNWLLPEGYMWKFGGNGDRPRKIEKVVSDLIGEQQAAQFWKEFRTNYITEADIIRMQELGFNSVRVALNARLFLTEGENPQFNPEGFALLENLVNWCKKHRMYVIIDMHGAPGGQTGENIDDSPNNLPELFMDKKHEDALVKLWIEIAAKYKDEPTVAAYDLLNEPLPERTGAAEKHKSQLEPLYRRLTEEIRKVDTRHMITLEGYNWSNNWSVFSKPFDNNTFYQFHYYCWNNPDNLNDISYFLKYRDTLNTPIWVGETGEKHNAIYWATTQYFAANNVGWSFWPWKKMDTKNTPYSIKKPNNWGLVAEYTRGGAKPDTATSKVILDELLSNIKLANCEYYGDVVNAIFRRIPGKVEAENYGHGGFGTDYYVSDSTKKSGFYRTQEPVNIELIRIDSTQRRHFTEQCIVLKPDEWTRYSFNSLSKADFKIIIKAASSAVPAKFQLECNGFKKEFELQSSQWDTLSTEGITMQAGLNKLLLKGVQGDARIDWMILE